MFKNVEKTRILVIQDEVENIRQPHADIINFFRSTLDRIFRDEQSYECTFASGQHAIDELSTLTPYSYRLVVFASNAIIRKSTPLYQYLEKHPDQIQNYIIKGGSAVFFHQGFAGTESDINFLSFSGAQRWTAPPGGVPRLLENASVTSDAQHSLLHYPHEVSAASLVEHSKKTGFPVSYFLMNIANPTNDETRTLIDVTGAHSGSLLACYENRGRLVVCPSPIDWMRFKELIENTFSWALFGTPRIIFLRSAGVSVGAQNLNSAYSMLQKDLSRRGSVAEIEISDERRNHNDAFLIKHASLFIVESDSELKDALSDGTIAQAISRGALLTHVERDQFYAIEHLNMLVGSRSRANFEREARLNLSHIVNSEWASSALLHDIRDLLLAAALNHQDAGSSDPFHIIATFLSDSSFASEHNNSFAAQIAARASAWLDQHKDIQTDPGTAIVALWLFSICDPKSRQNQSLRNEFAFISSDPRAEALTLLVEEIFSKGSTNYSLGDFFNVEADKTLTLGGVIRRLDAFYMYSIIRNSPSVPVVSSTFIKDLIDVVLSLLDEQVGILDASGMNAMTIAAITRLLLLGVGVPGTDPRHDALLREFIHHLSTIATAEGGTHTTGTTQLGVPGKTDSAAAAPAAKSDSEITVGSVEKLVSCFTLLHVERLFPRGATDVILSVQDEFTKRSESRALVDKLVGVNARLHDSEVRVEELQWILESQESSIRSALKVQVYSGIALFVFLIAILVGIGLFLVVRLLTSISDGNQAVNELVSLCTYAPVASAVIFAILRGGYLNPRRGPRRNDS